METARAGTSSAPDITVTVAPFRAWRGWRPIVAKKPTRAAIEMAIEQEQSSCWASKRARNIAEAWRLAMTGLGIGDRMITPLTSEQSLPDQSGLESRTSDPHPRPRYGHALIRNPQIRRRLAGLPEHIDRNPPPGVPVAADAQPARRKELHEPISNRDRAVLMKGAMIAKRTQVQLQRLALDEPFAQARSRSRDARNPAGR